MASIANKPLPPGASTELSEVAKWVHTSDARFAVMGNAKFCTNHEKLLSKTAKLLDIFLPELPKAPLERAVIVICFDEPTPVPIDAGWVAYFMPVQEVQGVTIDDHTLYSNHYVQLDHNVTVSGKFYGLAFLFRFEPRNRLERMSNFLKRALKKG
ncbi:hypothetical protein GQX73_g7325 [Xylaria multiplex]|uniref:Uncharacterized protein n=1 Tax=Xylaria multiplex TaxID=323545 RepID=A0A7C8IQ53_9PEZI|nr:hypothetical protein GQX73_g7325 [Xylaria multiplex]